MSPVKRERGWELLGKSVRRITDAQPVKPPVLVVMAVYEDGMVELRCSCCGTPAHERFDPLQLEEIK